jgi:hypothetical protein
MGRKMELELLRKQKMAEDDTAISGSVSKSKYLDYIAT